MTDMTEVSFEVAVESNNPLLIVLGDGGMGLGSIPVEDGEGGIFFGKFDHDLEPGTNLPVPVPCTNFDLALIFTKSACVRGLIELLETIRVDMEAHDAEQPLPEPPKETP